MVDFDDIKTQEIPRETMLEAMAVRAKQAYSYENYENSSSISSGRPTRDLLPIK
jgi:hypothetical protein